MTLTALAGRGRINEAILHFRRAVRISPKYAESHCNLGIVLASRGRIAGAVEQYREALDLATRQHKDSLARDAKARLPRYETEAT